ncbi:MAG: DUF302 domain-containing protein [Gammaproteobacteria bacterium]|nr:DUF302 domain-containing protein [Gammaproteobacteria bacterium]
MKLNTNKSGSNVGRWVKKSLCAGIVMGLSMSASTSFAGKMFKEDTGNVMTPYARIAHVQVVKDEYGNIDREATYLKAKEVATAIATYVHTVNDGPTGTGYPFNWILGGMEGGETTIEGAIMRIPSPFPINPDAYVAPGDKPVIKKANVIEFCNSYYAKQALGVAPIAGTTTTLPNGYIHAPALPCEVSTWNDDKNIYIDMLDPNAIFSIFFSDVLVSTDMQDPEFAAAITALPVAVKREIKEVVYSALDAADIKYNTKDKAMGPKYKTVEDIFEVVATSPQQSPYKHVAYTKTSGLAFGKGETAAVAKAIINTMSIHGELDAGKHDPALEFILSKDSKWRSARHEPLGLPGTPEKNWVIEACSPTYAKMAMGTGMHHATALPCEISVQRVDLTGDGFTESLVISYLDPSFMFGAMFSDITDDEKAALVTVPGKIIGDLQAIVQFALDDTTDILDLTLNDGVHINDNFTMLP